jgi:putative heme-binding domain-containing protein
VGGFNDSVAVRALRHARPELRCWAARLIGEYGLQRAPRNRPEDAPSAEFVRFMDAIEKEITLADLSELEENAPVRLQLAATCQRLDRSTRVAVLQALARHNRDAKDPAIPLMLWFAYEPTVAAERDSTLHWLNANAGGHTIITNELLPRTMRRLAGSGKPDDLAACVRFATEAQDSHLRRAALDGVVTALEGRRVAAPANWPSLRTRLSHDSDVAVRSAVRRLGANFQDAAAVRDAETTARDASRPDAERIHAVQSIGIARLSESLDTLERLLTDAGPAELRREVLHALAGYDRPDIPGLVIEHWQSLDDLLRTEAQTLLTSRRAWAHALLDSIAQRQLDQSALSAPAAHRITALEDSSLTAKLEKTWGSVRQQTPAEINTLINRMRKVVAATAGNATAGRDIFQQKCAVCHKFNGQGADVGPDITGADRSVEYLLINILDPNRVVGQPYYTHVVATKGGRVVTGKLVSDTPAGITIQGENDKIDVVPREDIDEHAVKHVSVMPEGLPKDMTDDQFRDLIEFLRRK